MIGRAKCKSPEAIRTLFSAVENTPIHAFAVIHVPLRHILDEEVPLYDVVRAEEFDLGPCLRTDSIAIVSESISLISLCLRVARRGRSLKMATRVKGHWEVVRAWLAFLLDVVVGSEEIDAEGSESLVNWILSLSEELLAVVDSTRELETSFPGLVEMLLRRWLRPDIFSGERDRLQRFLAAGLDEEVAPDYKDE